MKSKISKQYHLDAQGRFVIESYNNTPSFVNFFPGIAGQWGIPLWAFYVNRGQGITSFGIEGKDKAILEFLPANKAYQQTSLHGFRTFIKVKRGRQVFFYEPFQSYLHNEPFKTKSNMAITSHDLTLEETNLSLGLTVRVNYFTLPEEPYAALVRRLTMTNTSNKKYDLELIDGLPAIVPFGLNDSLLKYMSRTAEAWNAVSNLKNKIPFYNLKMAISDKPHVTHVTAGNFYMSFLNRANRCELLSPIVDSQCVFGHSSDFIHAAEFFTSKAFSFPQTQKTNNKTPSALSYAKFALAAKSSVEIISVTGHISSEKELNKITPRILTAGFIDQKARRNREIIDEIKNLSFTVSDSTAFDLYCGQTFLDNVLRGGLPISLETAEGKVALNVFSRKHGDPERDYNQFVLSPTFLSQGNGSYRDVNQNRRNDGWFNCDVKESNVVNFLNLIQPDGYNPLVIKGTTFAIDDPKKIDDLLKDCAEGKDYVRTLLTHGFLPGKLLSVVMHKSIQLKVPPHEFLKRVLAHCHKTESAEHGEGFWTDHWTYNLDLLESYFGLYPEEKRRLLLEKEIFTFYHNHVHVLPREQRYILTPDGVRQHHSVGDGSSHGKGIKKDNKLRAANGNIYHTHLLAKLLCMIANKAATFDPSGVGIEMEADKPNWYDALNGLSGLLGSSISETYELKRLSLFILDSFEELDLDEDLKVSLFEELHAFLAALSQLLALDNEPLAYWNKSNDVKENFRQKILSGVNGQEKEMSLAAIKKFLTAVVAKTDQAIEKAKNSKGLITTYFTHEVTEFDTYDRSNHDGFSFVRPRAFKRHILPLFLEGFVHALRLEKNPKRAAKLFEAVKKSPLFDKALKMYKVNADLSSESEEIGRTRIFPAGWLENESIWLHMEYKFLMELLRAGLHEKFYQEFYNVLVPFLNPQKYGRSILENSSFIVSSAHEDPRLHGRGFVARLSGSSAEVLHIWLMMNIGEMPFTINKQGKLSLQFQPVLEGRMFTQKEKIVSYFGKNQKWQKIALPKNSYAFNFLGSTLVVYHNPKRKDTFGPKKASIDNMILTYPDKGQVVVQSSIIPSPYSNDIRDGKLARLDIFLK